jgi:hypothetical protein
VVQRLARGPGARSIIRHGGSDQPGWQSPNKPWTGNAAHLRVADAAALRPQALTVEACSRPPERRLPGR